MKDIGFSHIKNIPEDISSWTVSKSIEINLSDHIFKEFDSRINGKITSKSICIIIRFKVFEFDIDKEINLECYHIGWFDKTTNPNYNRFMYIPKLKIDNYIRRNKLKNILE